MNVTYTIRDTELNAAFSEIGERIKQAQPKAELAMAERFQDCVLRNFGATGDFRPWSGWPPLSPRYAKKVGRTYATLEVSGRLKGNVLLELGANNNFRVTSSNDRVPYATVHQTGGGNNIPAREYFPLLEDGTVTRQVSDLCVEDARRALQEALS